MGAIQYSASPGVPHQSMEEELLCHRKCSEWWYCTGYLNDTAGRQYSFQFTIAHVKVYGFRLFVLMTALSDLQTGKHHYGQRAAFTSRKIDLNKNRVGFDGEAGIRFRDGRLDLSMAGGEYSLELEMAPVKPAVWHCDNGMLKMGIDKPGQTTYYWSYTNLSASGKLVLDGAESRVTGKAWFDRQGGTYNIIDRWTHWEWFSLRFFDDEEVMLFSFPQDDYRDGTFIDRAGNARRLTDYTVTPLGFTQAGGKKFSCGWKVSIPGVKDGEYTITPKMDGQLNLTYFELFADITDRRGKPVGYCITELLPGVYNDKINVRAVTARIK